MLPPASAAIFTYSLFHARSAPRTGSIRPQPAPVVPLGDFDARVLAILDAPAPHEDLRFTRTRKTAELLALFAQLTVAQTRALHARVWRPTSSDPIAVALSSLGIDHKAALVLFLGRHRIHR